MAGHGHNVKVINEQGSLAELQEPNENWLALMDASFNGHCDDIKVLFEKGTPVDLQDDLGQSALMAAVEQGSCEVAELLLEKGAQVDLQDNRGLSSLMHASFYGHCTVAGRAPLKEWCSGEPARWRRQVFADLRSPGGTCGHG